MEEQKIEKFMQQEFSISEFRQNDMDATKAFFAKLGFEPAFETVNDGAKVAFLKSGKVL